MNDAAKPLVYLIIGATGSGRREVLADLITDAFEPEEKPLVILAADEAANAIDEKLGETVRWQWFERGGGPEGMDSRIETEADVAVAMNAATHVFFVTDGRRNPVDQVEAFKPWLESVGGELARVITVVNCKLAEAHRELMAWYDACIHFSDVALLSRREGVPNKWISDFQARFKDKYYPCVFEFVKDGRVKNPALIIEPEARRMSHFFDEATYLLADGGDIEEGMDDDEDGEKPSDKRKDEEEIEVVEEIDEYMTRRGGGRRVKEIPDITKFLE